MTVEEIEGQLFSSDREWDSFVSTLKGKPTLVINNNEGKLNQAINDFEDFALHVNA